MVKDCPFIHSRKKNRSGILAVKRKLPSVVNSFIFSHQSLERPTFRDKFPSLNAIQTGGKSGRSPFAPSYDQRCTDLNDEQEEYARLKAYKLPQEFFKKKKDTTDFLEVTSLQK